MRVRRMVVVLATMAMVLGALAPVAAHNHRPGGGGQGGRSPVDHYVTGNGGDVTTSPAFGMLLAGGGVDVDSAMQAFLELADGGDVVVIRATGSDGYNEYLYDFGTVDSVETLVIPNKKAAASDTVAEVMGGAELIFLAGGDQWDYVSQWSDTQIVDILNEKAAAGVPIGGTSAGLAVLGEFLFSAKKGTVYSDEVLANPYNRYVHLDQDFVDMPYLDGLITDSHFTDRDRMGRLVGFLARIIQNGWADAANGVGIDEETAVLVNADGVGSVIGSGSATFLSADGPGEVVVPRTALTMTGVAAYELQADGGTFDFAAWSGSGGTAFTVDVVAGVLTTSG